MIALKELEGLPLVSALLNSTDKKALFLAFVEFSFLDKDNPADVRAVGQMVEDILQERARGVARIERKEVRISRNPLCCMAYYTQEIPRLFCKIFLGSPARSGSTFSGSDTGTIYFEWGPSSAT